MAHQTLRAPDAWENGASSSSFPGECGSHRRWVGSSWLVLDRGPNPQRRSDHLQEGASPGPRLYSQESLPQGRCGPFCRGSWLASPRWDGRVPPHPSDFGGVATPGALLKVYFHNVCVLIQEMQVPWDFHGSPVVKTWPSDAWGTDSIPGRGVKILLALGPKITEAWSRSDIVKRSVKTLKVVHIPLHTPPPAQKKKGMHDSQFSENSWNSHTNLLVGEKWEKSKDVVFTSSSQSAALSSTSSHVLRT